MITPGNIDRAEYCINESGVVDILQDGMRRSSRGRAPNSKKLELLFIGLLLSVQERGIATITSAHRVLTEDIEFVDQLRLGVVTGTEEHPRMLTLSDCYYQVEIITTRLAYGHSTRLILSQEERDRRRGVILRFNDALMDVFATALDLDDSTVAIDGSGIWAWARGGAYEPPSIEEIERIEDPLVRDVLIEAVRKGELAGEGPDAETIRLMKQSVAKSTKSVDQDAEWGGKTAKDGKGMPFFGYMVHALANVPESTIKEDPTAQPVLVRRFEVTGATKDVVEPTFRLIDSLPNRPSNILVDRLYNHKEYSRWQQPLIKRGIRQHFDLRSDDHGAVYVNGVPFTDGCGVCPGRPKGTDLMTRHSLFATKEEREESHARFAWREQFAMVPINQQTVNRRIKYKCPAVAEKVGCANRPGSVELAIRTGLPIIENEPNELRDGMPVPPCCTGGSFWIQMPELVAKLNQPKYWASKDWDATWRLRTYIEGVFGNFKNPSSENLHRGTMQIMGIVWANITIGIVVSAYNMRSLRNRQARCADESDHVLLAHDPGPQPWGYLSVDQKALEWQNHIDSMNEITNEDDSTSRAAVVINSAMREPKTTWRKFEPVKLPQPANAPPVRFHK